MFFVLLLIVRVMQILARVISFKVFESELLKDPK